MLKKIYMIMYFVVQYITQFFHYIKAFILRTMMFGDQCDNNDNENEKNVKYSITVGDNKGVNVMESGVNWSDVTDMIVAADSSKEKHSSYPNTNNTNEDHHNNEESTQANIKK